MNFLLSVITDNFSYMVVKFINEYFTNSFLTVGNISNYVLSTIFCNFWQIFVVIDEFYPSINLCFIVVKKE